MAGESTWYLGTLIYYSRSVCRSMPRRKRSGCSFGRLSANNWQDEDAKAKVEAMKTAHSETLKKCGGEQWVINSAIHYNEWASFTKGEFRAVVEVFKALLLQLRCPKVRCDSWLYVTPRKGDLEVLRCLCMALNLNLRPK